MSPSANSISAVEEEGTHAEFSHSSVACRWLPAVSAVRQAVVGVPFGVRVDVDAQSALAESCGSFRFRIQQRRLLKSTINLLCASRHAVILSESYTLFTVVFICENLVSLRSHSTQMHDLKAIVVGSLRHLLQTTSTSTTKPKALRTTPNNITPGL